MLFRRKKKEESNDYLQQHLLHRELEQILIMVGHDAMQLIDRKKVNGQDAIEYINALQTANLDNPLSYTHSIKIHLEYIICYLKVLKEEKTS